MVVSIIFAVFIAFSSGIVISGGVFAFITMIGIVPRLAQKTKTQKYIKIYESCILIGGCFGISTNFIDYYLPLGKVFVAFLFLCIGIFVGCLAVSLAEVLDVIPILSRRLKVEQGVPIFILILALGKMVGSFIYYILPGFFNI